MSENNWQFLASAGGANGGGARNFGKSGDLEKLANEGGAAGGLHIAVVMDGNGRWAQQRFLPRSAGHEAGAKALVRLIRACAEREDIATLSVFAFSTENWRRPQHEISALFALLDRFLARSKDDFVRERVHFRAFGDTAALEQSSALAQLERETRTASPRLEFNLGVNYGAIDECARAAAALASAGREITPRSLLDALDVPQAVDIFIRTGARTRLSNFMLLQSAYAHVCFCDELFPDFSAAQLDAAIASFRAQPRTFGGL